MVEEEEEEVVSSSVDSLSLETDAAAVMEGDSKMGSDSLVASSAMMVIGFFVGGVCEFEREGDEPEEEGRGEREEVGKGLDMGAIVVTAAWATALARVGPAELNLSLSNRAKRRKGWKEESESVNYQSKNRGRIIESHFFVRRNGQCRRIVINRSRLGRHGVRIDLAQRSHSSRLGRRCGWRSC